MNLSHSEQINELASALSKAQGAMRGALKDADNPFFKSRYADLASVWEACRKPLTDHGLSILQSPSVEGHVVRLETLLLHESGQFIKGTIAATAKDEGPQAIGSTLTYLRRYALQSFAGVAPEDDDGEAAEGRTSAARSAYGHPVASDRARPKAPRPLTPPEQKAVEAGQGDTLIISTDQAKRLYAIAKNGGWSDIELKAWLKEVWGYDSSKQIPRRQYDEIVKGVQEGPQ